LKTIYNFIIKPIGNKYENSIDVEGKELILNTSYENYKFINRIAEVIAIPLSYEHTIAKGDIVLLHHNVFRTWYDIRGDQRTSSSYINDNEFKCSLDQIYAVFKNNIWQSLPEYCFVAPVSASNSKNIVNKKEKELFGIVKMNNNELKNKGVNENDLVSFTPSSEFEFLLNEQKLYRIKNQDITATYGYKKNEIEYNTSWRKSCRRIDKSSKRTHS
jgi:hypothetical protein